MIRFQGFSVSIVLLLAVSTVQSANAQVADRGYDNLFEDGALQRIVDLQNARNSSSLVGFLSDKNPVVRSRAALVLASVQDSTALEALVDVLDDESAQVRAHAAFAIGQTGAPPPGVLASWLVDETDTGVLYEVIQALGKVGSPEDLRRLVNASLPETLDAARIVGITRFSLRSMISPEAVAHQVRFLTHEDPTLREKSAYYFWRLRASDAWRSRVDELRKALMTLDVDDAASGYLAVAVSTLGAPEDLPLILPAMRSADERVRVRAVRAIGQYSAESSARAEVLRALSDESHHVSITASSVIASWDDLTESERRILEQLIHPSNTVGSIIAGNLLTGLSRSGHHGTVMELLELHADIVPDLRSHLIAPLAYVPDADARRTLIDFLGSSNKKEAIAAANALVVRWERRSSENKREYYDAFVSALKSGDIGLVYMVASVLTEPAFVERGSVQAMAGVLSSMEPPDDTEAMLSIIAALGRIDSKSARSELERVAVHPHDVIRMAARRHIEKDDQVASGAVIRAIDWQKAAEYGPRPQLQFQTETGSFIVELFADLAPQTAGTIIQLAQAGRYDGVPFHRVVPDFVAQGGDISRGDGFGGPGFEIRSEFTGLSFDRGIMGMASAGKDTEGSQFFITHSMQPHLDGNYTAFGRVLSGMNSVDAIEPETLILSVRLMD